MSQRLPTEIPAQWMPGQQLYQRQRSFVDPLWAELDEQQRETWGNVERYVAFRERQRVDPLTVVVEGETAIERHERHVQAVRGAIGSRLDLDPPRELCEDIVAAADTGI